MTLGFYRMSNLKIRNNIFTVKLRNKLLTNDKLLGPYLRNFKFVCDQLFGCVGFNDIISQFEFKGTVYKMIIYIRM